MEINEIENKLLQILDTKSFMLWANPYARTGSVKISIDGQLMTWDNILTGACLYIRLIYESSTDYEAFSFKLGLDGYLIEFRSNRALHEIFSNFIAPDFDKEIYKNILENFIEKEPCPLNIIPSFPDSIISIFNDVGLFDSYDMEQKIWLYEKTNNDIFITKDIKNIFIF